MANNIEHIHYVGKVHIKTGSKTACGENLNLHPEHWKETIKPVSCEKCKLTRS